MTTKPFDPTKPFDARDHPDCCFWLRGNELLIGPDQTDQAPPFIDARKTRTIAEILADAEITADGLYIFRVKLPRAESALVVQYLAELHGIDLTKPIAAI